MKKLTIIAELYYFVLSRRYKISLKGEELLNPKGARLILPNHPAQIDAPLLSLILYRRCDVVPVVSERFMNMPLIGYFVKALGSIPVSDLKFGNRDPKVLDTIHEGVKQGLKNGKSILIYPAGNITRTQLEVIKNKQSAFAVASTLTDNVQVIGARIHGLRGSMWAVSNTGKLPNFGQAALKSTLYLLANFIFFLPKRNVSIEFIDITEEIRAKAKTDRSTFNRYLEDFYNLNGPEPDTYVKYISYLPGKSRV
ncbi:MAG: 1-acyl-sn-glycerol-3-phosphate acyltransferase [Bacteroidetes bacterium]|nr:1-acyl-sn-glycerol-3-phosphate acyltransferase [Bacteroidota bacterium]